MNILEILNNALENAPTKKISGELSKAILEEWQNQNEKPKPKSKTTKGKKSKAKKSKSKTAKAKDDKPNDEMTKEEKQLLDELEELEM